MQTIQLAIYRAWRALGYSPAISRSMARAWQAPAKLQRVRAANQRRECVYNAAAAATRRLGYCATTAQAIWRFAYRDQRVHCPH